MVFPLLVIALLRRSFGLEECWRAVLHVPRLRLFGWRLGWTELASAAIFAGMGGLAVAPAVSGRQTTGAENVPWWLQLAVLAFVAAAVTASLFVGRQRFPAKAALDQASRLPVD